MDKMAENKGTQPCNSYATAMQQPVQVVLQANEFGPSRKATVIPAPPPEPEVNPLEGLNELENYVALRLREAGDVLRRMPGGGGQPSGEDREFPLPTAEEVDRMDEVIGDWMCWLKGSGHERVVAWHIAGFSFRKMTKKDPHRRSHEGLRKALHAACRFLAQQLVHRHGKPAKWLLTELTEKG